MVTVREKLLFMWTDILGKSDIHATEEFSEVGGTSMGLLRVLARIKAELGVTVFHCDLPAHITIDSLARVIERQAEQSSVCRRRRGY
jgi:hypothetical protein